MTPKNAPVLPLDFNIPKEVSEIKGRDGETYLQFATHMTTFYKQTYGEHSRFFLALRDAKLLGAKCPECGQVRVPAATWHCPACNFVEMKEVELPHRGVLAATAPITIFPSASFLGEAPFCRGYIDVALDAPAASYLPSRLRTTTGLPRPGIFVKGVELKLVFEDDRVGSIRDIFWVPVSEVPADLLDKEPLYASELYFETPAQPEVEASAEGEEALQAALAAMTKLATDAGKSARATQDLSNRTHRLGIHTSGGDFGIFVTDGSLRVEPGMPESPDFVMVTDDPGVFSAWVDDGSLTDAVVEGKLWLPHRAAFAVLPALDRLPRSIRRDLRDD
jgi:uncharacterized OB-fold protein